MASSEHRVETIEKYIYPAVDRLFGESDGHKLQKSPDTALFGAESKLDSLDLVDFLMAVEERIEADTGKVVRIVNEKAMSQRNSPLRTFSTLAAYIDTLLAESAS